MNHRVKRRDFLKAGLGASGLVVAESAAFFSPLDTSPGSQNQSNHPWWVTEVDKPTLAIDDKVYQRFDGKKTVLHSFREYIGPERSEKVRENASKFREKCRKENIAGYRLEDRALKNAAWRIRGTGGLNRGTRVWVRPEGRRSRPAQPEKWQGSPEEAANIIKRAARFYGASSTGVTLLDRRHIFSESYRSTVRFEFEEVDKPYQVEGEKLVIPEKCKYAIALCYRMSPATAALGPSALCDATSGLGYSRAEFLVASLSEFIRNLGYIAIPEVNDLGGSIPIAVDAGLGQLGRMNRLITPEYGPFVQVAKVLTDLPMAVDKPIDFGIKEFCTVCKRCAQACPSGAVSKKDEPDFEIRGEWNNPGHQAWYEDSVSCFQYWEEYDTYCSVCFQVCPWAKQDKTVLHSIIKAASAKIPALDGFFVSLDEKFGYGRQKDMERWWELELLEYGLDTISRKG